MPWKLTVRAGSRVEHARFAKLEQALENAERRADALAGTSAKEAVDLRVRRFDPVQQVAARIEVAGPERVLPRVRGGIDVRGNGSSEAYVGGVRREAVAQRHGETPIEALQRALLAKLSG